MYLGLEPQPCQNNRAKRRRKFTQCTILFRLYYFRTVPVLHVRTVSTNGSDPSHGFKKWTNSVASRGFTAQECSWSTIASFRFTSAGAVGG